MLKTTDCPLGFMAFSPSVGYRIEAAQNLANVLTLAVLACLASIRIDGVVQVVSGVHMRHFNLGCNGFESTRY